MRLESLREKLRPFYTSSICALGLLAQSCNSGTTSELPRLLTYQSKLTSDFCQDLPSVTDASFENTTSTISWKGDVWHFCQDPTSNHISIWLFEKNSTLPKKHPAEFANTALDPQADKATKVKAMLAYIKSHYAPPTSDLPNAVDSQVKQEFYENISSENLVFADSEFVYGVADANFDLAEFMAKNNIAGYENVLQTSMEFSVSPKLLLAMLSYKNELFQTNNLGYLQGLAFQINEGYYNFQFHRNFTINDQTYTNTNASTFALWHYYAKLSPNFQMETNSLREKYLSLFTSNQDLRIKIPNSPVAIDLPFAKGETWYFTGGAHGAFGVTSAWTALDFMPATLSDGTDIRPRDCSDTRGTTRAVGDGTIAYIGNGTVFLDLIDPKDARVLYLHSTRPQVQIGQRVIKGDAIAHTSCEGGVADGPHVHLAVTFQGQWTPLILDGYFSNPGFTQYSGTIQKGNEVIYPSSQHVVSEELSLITHN